MPTSPFQGVIQFMHPGAEHTVGVDGWTPWNMTTHRRKFLFSKGTFLDAAGDIDHADLQFWGEWEAPSRSVFSWEKDPYLPNHLVVPEFPGPARQVSGLQNTDPYVFGEVFRYTLCKQSKRTGQETYLANLAPGTLILFGSKVNHQFLLDTVFVVDENPITHSTTTWQRELSNVSSVYRSVTLDPMYWDTNTMPETSFKMYTGVRNQSPLHGMFSFFPCKPAQNLPQRFQRPILDIPGITNQALMMGGKRTSMSLDQIEQCWHEVVRQVTAQNLQLGLSAKEPERSAVPEHLWPH
jgi:hypothetical protein